MPLQAVNQIFRYIRTLVYVYMTDNMEGNSRQVMSRLSMERMSQPIALPPQMLKFWRFCETHWHRDRTRYWLCEIVE
jgi:hypothetical protein